MILKRLRIRTRDLEFILKGRPQSDDVNIVFKSRFKYKYWVQLGPSGVFEFSSAVDKVRASRTIIWYGLEAAFDNETRKY